MSISKSKTGSVPSDSIFQYSMALHRLVEGKPVRVESGTAITLAAVALEAGKSAGSIKRQRPVYAELIKEVKRCASEQKLLTPSNKKTDKQMIRWKTEAQNWKQLYHQSLARELMLLHQLDEAEHLLRSGDNVYQFPSKADRGKPDDS